MEICYQKCGDHWSERKYSIFKNEATSLNSLQCDILTLCKGWEDSLSISIYYILTMTIPKLYLSHHTLLKLLKSYRINSSDWLPSHSWFSLQVCLCYFVPWNSLVTLKFESHSQQTKNSNHSFTAHYVPIYMHYLYPL